MKICIAGASGFIGKNLVDYLMARGVSITVISRSDFIQHTIKDKIKDQDVLINLIGRTIQGRWSRRIKKQIYESRINTTRILAEEVNKHNTSIRTFINVSAVGIYDNLHLHDEGSAHMAGNFLAHVIQDWEAQVYRISDPGIRKVICRLGVVLGDNGGMVLLLNRLLRCKIGVSIDLTEGFPFIHITDLVRAFEFVVNNESLSGCINVVSPDSLTIEDFFNKWNAQGNTWLTLRFNKTLLKLLMGESSILFSEGQKVIPSRLLEAGFRFAYKDIERAIDEVIYKKRKQIESL